MSRERKTKGATRTAGVRDAGPSCELGGRVDGGGRLDGAGAGVR